MKLFLYPFFAIFPILLFAQEGETSSIDSLSNSEVEPVEIINDSVSTSEKNIYIKDYTDRFNVKFEVSNSVPIFNTPLNDNYVQVEPNLGTKYAAVLSYGILSVRLGIRAKGSDESIDDKGEPKAFRLHFKLLFDRWSHQFEYNQIKGYYISESEDPIIEKTTNPYIQFPDLTTKTFNGTTAYKLNDNYSVRATISQTERQIKSAGSFIPSLSYSIYGIEGTDSYLDEFGELVKRDSYSETFGITTIVHMGYYYTFVYKNWYANTYLIPGMGSDFNKLTNHGPEGTTKNKYTDFIISLQGGVGFGYNAKNFFLGGFISRSVRDQKNHANKTEFKTTKDAFSLYIGYRFKAPKKIADPIDKLEEKLPFTDKKDN